MSLYTLKIDCRDEKGLVYRISKILFEHGLNIERNDECVDEEPGLFFLRAELKGQLNAEAITVALRAVLPEGARVCLGARRKKRVVILATKEPHCLGDLLLRHDSGALNAEILAVVANHAKLGPLCARFGVPFHHVSHRDLSREAHEAAALEVLEGYDLEYLVLAKYMRILSPSFVARFPGQIINIHHSFLPAFIGANPYKQAHARGVKIIGATAHFVTDDLDEGPIIAQDVSHVSHDDSWREMRRAGRDVEQLVLAKALGWVLEDRVFTYANKTIIF